MTPRKILFICTGNICRSATAEVLALRKLRAMGLAGVEVSSAGVFAEPGRPCPSETVASLARRGADARGHRARALTPELVEWADLILAMTEDHRTSVARRYPKSVGKVTLFTSYAGLSGDVEDPYEGGPKEHDACTARIDEALEKILTKLGRGAV